MSKRVLFFGSNNSTNKIEYTLGSGVGRKPTAIRNLLSKRAVIAPSKKQVMTIDYVPGRARKILNMNKWLN